MNKSIFKYEISASELSLFPSKIWKEIGYSSDNLPEELKESISSVIDYINKNINVCCVFRLDSGSLNNNIVTLSDGTILSVGKTNINLLSGATSFAVFIATVDNKYEYFLKELQKENKIIEAYIADVTGTILVEEIQKYMINQLELKISSKENHTSPIYSGSCGWSISNQTALFEYMREETCGVHLNDSYMMLPVKSVSGIIGIGKNVDTKDIGCKYCNLKLCYKRKHHGKN